MRCLGTKGYRAPGLTPFDCRTEAIAVVQADLVEFSTVACLKLEKQMYHFASHLVFILVRCHQGI